MISQKLSISALGRKKSDMSALQTLNMVLSSPDLNSDWIKQLPAARVEYKELYGEEWPEEKENRDG